jgi:aminoglycoside phosphotransferase (APT) family kinase protein
MQRRLASPGRARARAALYRAARERFGSDARVEVSKVSRIGQGPECDAFVAEVRVMIGREDPAALRLVAEVPRPDADQEVDVRARREPAVVSRLASMRLPFRTPSWALTVTEGGRAVLVRDLVAGFPIKLRVDWNPSFNPWQIVGRLAAEVHAVEITTLSTVLPLYPTRRAHADAELVEVGAIRGDAVTDDVLAWLAEHRPAVAPGRLVHGDLDGRNILLHIDRAVGLVGWQHCCIGDPAWDLAVVTRGSRRPFGVHDGLGRLLDAYLEAGGIELGRSDIHFYELSLAARRYLAARRGRTGDEASSCLARLGAILRRAEAEGRG